MEKTFEASHSTSKLLQGTREPSPCPIGIKDYLACMFIPSWKEWGPWEYYEKPWETSADILGNVASRNHSTDVTARGFSYLDAAIKKGILVWGEIG